MNKQTAYNALSQLYKTAPVIKLSGKDKIVIFSDLHMGSGSYRDDFLKNSEMFKYIIKHNYLKQHYSLILNGDIEDLFKFSLRSIRKRWPDVYSLYDELY